MSESVLKWWGRGAPEAPGATGLNLTALPPLSIYVHWPWCLRKCPYCDFNSHEWRATPGAPLPLEVQRRYAQALVADLEQSLPLVWGRMVHSVFMGGGTPSLIEPDIIEGFLNDLRARVRLEPGAEITLEANPGTFETDRFAAFRRAGITRLSVGVQSFNDGLLQAIGRVHSGAQARAAVEEAAATFDTWNLDLMYALPGQDLDQWAQDVGLALALKPPHLSLYHLTVEPNTRFAVQPPPQLPDDDSAYDMLDHLLARTQEAGLQRYEVSAFARPGHRCTHNLNYWRFGDYLGMGAGAHGKLSFAHRIVRQTKWREPARYMDEALNGRALSNEQAVAVAQLPFEFMLNGLRLVDGVSLLAYQERTGQPLWSLDAALQQAQAAGLLERADPMVKPSARGLDFLSDLQAMFLPDDAA